MPLLRHQQVALVGLKYLFGLILAVGIIVAICMSCGCQPTREEIAVHHESSALAVGIAAALEAKDRDGKVYIVAPTGSMRPTLLDGDYIVALKTPYADLKVGMVVNYFATWNAGKLTCHRIAGSWPTGGFLLEGDGEQNRAETKSKMDATNYVDRIVSAYRWP